MNAKEMLALMNERPFQPFDIHLANGDQVHVEEPFHLAVQPNSSICFVFEDEGLIRRVAYRNIVHVVSYSGEDQVDATE